MNRNSPRYTLAEQYPNTCGLVRAYYHGGVPVADVPGALVSVPPPPIFRVYNPSGELADTFLRIIESLKTLTHHALPKEEIIHWDVIETESPRGDLKYEVRWLVEGTAPGTAPLLFSHGGMSLKGLFSLVGGEAP